jgi:hypothetical protein
MDSAYASWGFGYWLLCFKYWQTSFELSFLFMMRDEERSRKHRIIFIAMNGFALGLCVLSWLLSAIGQVNR